jgi:predicted acylesterase/phospholipase RssA
MESGVWNPTGVSFGSGGVRTIGHLGVLSHLLSCGILENVRDWYGCSGGAICALIGALGGSISWINDVIHHFDMSIFAGVEEDLVLNFLDRLGVNSGDRMIEFMKRIFETWEPGCSNWTFADLAAKRPGITLTIIATNLTECKLKLFSTKDTPDVLLFDAMRASSAIPLYFTPWKDTQGNLLCDGAILEVYPWSPVTDKVNTLVVVCSVNDIGGRKERKHDINSVSDYMSSLYHIFTKNRSVKSPRHWIAVNNRKYAVLDFHITAEDRIALFKEGVSAAAGWNSFRKKVLSSEKHGIHRPSLAHRTSPSCHPSPNRKWDTPLLHIPRQQPYPAPDSHTGGSLPARRWSL